MNLHQSHSQRHSQRHSLSILLIALMLIGVGVWMFCTGDLSDDLWYRHELEPNTTSQLVICGNDTITQDYAWCKGKSITEWNQIFTSCGRHYMHHGNGRLPNMLIYLENMIPAWVFDLMQVLMMGIMGVMMLRIGLPRWRYRPLATVLALWSIWIVMPWDDQMASTVFMMNYVWASALNLLFLATVLGYVRLPNWAIYPLAAVAAIMHEGFSVPFGAGLLVFYIQSSKSDRKQILWPVVTYLIFSLYVIFPPATIQRFIGASEVDKGPIFSLQNLYRYFVKSYMPVLTLCVMAWYGYKRGWEQLWQQLRRMLPLLTIAIVSLAVGLIMRGTGRMIWPALLMLLIVCWRLISALHFRQCNRGLVAATALCLGMALCGWLCYIGVLQHRADKEMDNIAQAMKQSGTDLVYVNTTQRSDLPWWVLNIPEYYHTAHPTVKGAHYASQRQREYFGLITLPEAYRGVPLDSLPNVQGNTGFRGEYPFYYSPKYLGQDILATFSLGSMPIEPVSGAAPPPYLLYAKIQDIHYGTPIRHTYHMYANPVVQHPGDTIWFYLPDKFATSDLNRPIQAVDLVHSSP